MILGREGGKNTEEIAATRCCHGYTLAVLCSAHGWGRGLLIVEESRYTG